MYLVLCQRDCNSIVFHVHVHHSVSCLLFIIIYILTVLFQALDNVPLLLYILAAKTLLLCLAFAGAKLYQQKKVKAALKQQFEAKRKLAQETQELIDNKKDD